MTPTERVAYNAGIKAAINAAQIVSLTIETAEDASTFRKRVAAETMAAFAESAKALMLGSFPSEGYCLNVDQNSALPVRVEA